MLSKNLTYAMSYAAYDITYVMTDDIRLLFMGEPEDFYKKFQFYLFRIQGGWKQIFMLG